MTFYINGIKEHKNKENDQINLEFLVSTENEEKTREIAITYWIIILSIKEFTDNTSSFWNFYFVANYWLTQIIITPKQDNKSLQDICKNYLKVWFDIITIKDYQNRLTDIKIEEIINESKKILEKENDIQKISKDKIQEKEKQFFEDKELDRLKEVIKWILPRCNEIIDVLSAQGSLNPKTIKDIKDSEENIKKLSMWTNSEKIKESLQKLFQRIEELEPDYYKILEKDWKKIYEESVITNFDIIKEEYKLQYAINKNKAWLAVNANNQYYLIFGKLWIFLSFLKIDLINKTLDFKKVISKFYDLIEIALIMISCEIIFYMIFSYFMTISDFWSLFNIMINVSILWLTFSFFKLLSKKNIYIFYGIIPICVILFFIIKSFIISNFAL